MSESLYSRLSNLIIGFHGTTRDRAEKVFNGSAGYHASTNDYDWLGSGMYFWENNYKRAEKWAVAAAKRKGEGAEPAVIGAILDLGYCLDLTDSEHLEELKVGYNVLKESFEKDGKEIGFIFCIPNVGVLYCTPSIVPTLYLIPSFKLNACIKLP